MQGRSSCDHVKTRMAENFKEPLDDYHFDRDHYDSCNLYICIPWFYGDPYGDADQLPVAVVNHDKKVNYEGKTLQVGDDLVKNLKDSGSLDFHFM